MENTCVVHEQFSGIQMARRHRLSLPLDRKIKTMNDFEKFFLYYSLFLCTLIFIICFAVNLGLAIDCYKKNPISFFKTLIDYSAIVKYMAPKEKKLFYATFIGVIFSALPFGYAMTLAMNYYLNK
jgi:hypothetical protein